MELILYLLAGYGLWSGYVNFVRWRRQRRLIKMVNSIWAQATVTQVPDIIVPRNVPKTKPKLTLLQGGKDSRPEPPAPPAPAA